MTDLTTLTGADLLKTLYPSRWYGVLSDDRSGVTAIVDTHHNSTYIGALPPVSDMIPLTQTQFVEALNAPFRMAVKDGALVYPQRYAAAYVPVTGPARVAVWVDRWDMRASQDFDEAYRYLPMTVEQWNDQTLHTTHGVSVVEDALVKTPTIATDLTVQQIAQSLIPMVETEIVRKYSIRGRDIPEAVSAYLKDLDTVASDPTATTLPIPPKVEA